MTYKDKQAIIYGSFLLYMIDVLLTPKEKTNGTTIRLKQLIKSKISKKEYIPIRVLSNEAWFKAVDEVKDKNLQIAVFQFVENLVLDNVDIFKDFYGERILELAGNFAFKHTLDLDDELLHKVVRDTAELTDSLKKNTSKVIYEESK